MNIFFLSLSHIPYSLGFSLIYFIIFIIITFNLVCKNINCLKQHNIYNYIGQDLLTIEHSSKEVISYKAYICLAFIWMILSFLFLIFYLYPNRMYNDIKDIARLLYLLSVSIYIVYFSHRKKILTVRGITYKNLFNIPDYNEFIEWHKIKGYSWSNKNSNTLTFIVKKKNKDIKLKWKISNTQKTELENILKCFINNSIICNHNDYSK